MAESELDLLIIGGGITGAGTALDAQTRGMETGLIEMQDFAAGTSSRSTKLIHGGLRYLKNFEVKMVAEVGKERAIVYENAPHVTTPLRIMLPFYKGGTFGSFTTSIGLSIYDRLAGVKKAERRTMMSAKDAKKNEPILADKQLRGAGMYVEYRTDDARLTLEVAKTAAEKGAQLANYVKAESFIYDDDKVIGVVARDVTTNKTIKIYAKKIVNATGPWVDHLREQDRSKTGKTIHLSKGVHLVFSKKRLPLQQAIYFDTPFKDGRMMFAIPRGDKVYVGTTETGYDGDQREPGVTDDDVAYIIKATNAMFPGYHIAIDDVESSWSGLRPLIHEEGKDPSDISRKDEIFHSKSGLITIAGGKLTGYRKMADSIVSMVAEELEKGTGASYPACQTKKLVLSGGDVGGSQELVAFNETFAQAGMKLGLDEKTSRELVERYGSNVSQVFMYLEDEEADTFQLPKDVWASLRYALEHEMTLTPVDFFLRRTSYLLFDIDKARENKEAVVEAMAAKLQWSKEEKARCITELNEMWEILTFVRG
ncbi:glycerol-3-phosphate dehydrogenase/oxidase [Salicibibacter halophilus]|uniref:Glycerol-3-phosphate dehydrogenase n=1 Tax=Salicibibacter halophilus TaxID=2502791 RepID=A0A514LMH4_9BACI|nr:glycerol-3-phosphate dehydrogenase/oxidase [Salicibibacter halophilus]QDI93057.1 glycerol-3-phosphate dehydrogenase/oxidase [Salicibibacter halophilus]